MTLLGKFEQLQDLTYEIELDFYEQQADIEGLREVLRHLAMLIDKEVEGYGFREVLRYGLATYVDREHPCPVCKGSMQEDLSYSSGLEKYSITKEWLDANGRKIFSFKDRDILTLDNLCGTCDKLKIEEWLNG